MTEILPAIRALAEAHGVATEYWDWQGQHVRVPAATVIAVLSALGVDVSSPEAAAASLVEHGLDRWRQPLPACLVVRAGDAAWFPVHLPHGEAVEVWVELEDGGRSEVSQQQHWVDPRFVDGVLLGEATFAVSGSVPLGWHTLCARWSSGSATAPLVVTPGRLELPDALHGKRTWGVLAQLYSVRSARSWGTGDLADLADLATWAGHELGAGFVLVNPLHAASPLPPMEPSPYLPVTRRFANPLYLRVEAVAEHAYLDPADRAFSEQRSAALRAASRTDARLDRDAAWAAKREVLERVAAVPLTAGRAAAFAAYREVEGEGLRDFATWCALVETRGWPWQDWPSDLRDPASPAVAAERERLADLVSLHERFQWWLDEQLGGVAATGPSSGDGRRRGPRPRGRGAPAGRGRVGSGRRAGEGSQRRRAAGRVQPAGPGLVAAALAASVRWRPPGTRPYRDMLRTVLRHAGGLRVDHVLGLFRLWWIPQGAGPTQGTYVRSNHAALVGILALEAQRAGAVIIGEDLGTVDPWVRDVLHERGVAGTSILWFERDRDGRPLPAEYWRPLCLATVTTHDLPPTAGYLAGEHVRIRSDLGLLTRSVEQERAQDAADQAGWLAELAGTRPAADWRRGGGRGRGPASLPRADALPAARRRAVGPRGRPAGAEPAGHHRRVPELAAAARRPRRCAAAAR